MAYFSRYHIFILVWPSFQHVTNTVEFIYKLFTAVFSSFRTQGIGKEIKSVLRLYQCRNILTGTDRDVIS